MKYNMLKTFGCNYSWNTLDNEDNLGILLLNYCMTQENKAMERQREKNTFYSEALQ